MIKHVPCMVRPDTESPCGNISAGTDSTLVADREGRLMVWGDQNRRVRPEQVAYMLRGKKVRQVRLITIDQNNQLISSYMKSEKERKK
jgi:hypothetical protein